MIVDIIQREYNAFDCPYCGVYLYLANKNNSPFGDNQFMHAFRFARHTQNISIDQTFES